MIFLLKEKMKLPQISQKKKNIFQMSLLIKRNKKLKRKISFQVKN